MTKVFIDTGPLVAIFSSRDQWHEWSAKQAGALAPPFYTSAPVLTESTLIPQRIGGDPCSIIRSLKTGALELSLDIKHEASELEKIMSRYRTVPMSLADASLVRLSEQFQECFVLTVDRDFRIYRRFGRQTIPLIAPWQQS